MIWLEKKTLPFLKLGSIFEIYFKKNEQTIFQITENKQEKVQK